MIKFGTDGWRAIISDQFTIENVRVVAQAIADYILEDTKVRPVLVIGYDTRFLSDIYAEECAKVLSANGIKVMLTQGVTSTPAVSYAVKQREAQGGIMITASHNSYRYNGIKFKAAYGGSALPEIIAAIESKLFINPPRLASLIGAETAGRIEYFNANEAYLNQLRSLVDIRKIAQSGLKVVIDPMHGAGSGIIKTLLAAEGMQVIEIRGARDPLFGGVNPEPIKPNLQALIDAVKREKADIGLATDGDGDRVGAIDVQGEFINAHIIYALLLWHLVTRRDWMGGVVKTFSTSRMIDLLAAEYGLPVYETPIGFKYICELFLKEDILLGGEESGGIGFKNHIPERDGLLSSLFLLEMLADYGKPLQEIIEDLMGEVGYHFYDRIDLHLTPEINEKAMKLLNSHRPSHFAGAEIKEIQTLDGTKFILKDGSWILFRPSGTEPVMRLYAEAGDTKSVFRLLEEARMLLS